MDAITVQEKLKDYNLSEVKKALCMLNKKRKIERVGSNKNRAGGRVVSVYAVRV